MFDSRMLKRIALITTGSAFVMLWVWFWFYSGSAFTLAPHIGFAQIVVFMVLSKNYELGGIIFGVMSVSLIVVLSQTSETASLLGASGNVYLSICLASAVVHAVYGIVVGERRKTVHA
jgi:hypothetical protein